MSCSLQRKLLCSLDTSAFAAALTVSAGATLPSCAAFRQRQQSIRRSVGLSDDSTAFVALLPLRSTTGALLDDSSPDSSRRRYTTGVCASWRRTRRASSRWR